MTNTSPEWAIKKALEFITVWHLPQRATNNLARFLAETRQQAIEEAAQVCSDLMDQEVERAFLDIDAHHYCEALSKAEDAIRAIDAATEPQL